MSLLLLFGGGPTTVTPDHWATIREGDILLLHLPTAGLSNGAKNIVARVLSRTYNPTSNLLDIEIAVQWPFTASGVLSLGADGVAPNQRGTGVPINPGRNPGILINRQQRGLTALQQQVNEL